MFSAMKVRSTAMRSLALGYCLAIPRSVAAWTTTTRPTTRLQLTGKPSLSSSSSLSRSFVSSPTTLQAKKEATFPTWSFDEPCQSMAWNSLVEARLEIKADANAEDANADLVVIGVMAPPKEDGDDDEEEDDNNDKEPEPVALSGVAADLDAATGGALTAVLTENAKNFKMGAKLGSMTPIVRLVVNGKTTRYLLMGLGPTPKDDNGDDKEKQDPFEAAGFSLGLAVAGKCNDEKKVGTCQVILPEVLASSENIVTDFSSSFYQTLYADNRFKTKAKQKKVAEELATVTILSEGSACDTTAIETGKSIATGVFLTKDIVNAPHNVLNSESLADTAKRIAAESKGRLTCKILNKAECEKRGMGAYLGVARGSETEPQFIHLTYKPPSGKVNKKVGVIGKGLLFDTGGYNIKTAMMEMMKFDCGGAAAVLGAARAVGMTAPEGVEAHFIVAACENMISGKAVVPSDILTASNGKTIEVMNTDAEGRLTLADALVYADKEVGAESIIELSTLTGACMISLGTQIAGVWTTNDDLAADLDSVSKATKDSTWRMPMAKEYMEQLDSKFADMKNIGTRYGGAITAALFLTNFVSPKKPFAHVDIAGPVWSEKEGGATGFGSKLVQEWVRRQGIKSE